MEDAYKILIIALIALFPFFYHHETEKKEKAEVFKEEQMIEEQGEAEAVEKDRYVAVLPEPKGEGSLEIDRRIKVAVLSFEEVGEEAILKRVLNTLNKVSRFEVLNLRLKGKEYLPEIEMKELAELTIYGKVLASSLTFLTVELKVVEINRGILYEETLLGTREKVYEEIEEFVKKIEDGLPLLTGRVVHRGKDKVVLSLGKEEGLIERRKLIVSRISGLKQGPEGQILGVRSEDVGYLEVEEVFLDKSFARILKEVEGEGQIRAGDIVRTK